MARGYLEFFGFLSPISVRKVAAREFGGFPPIARETLGGHAESNLSTPRAILLRTLIAAEKAQFFAPFPPIVVGAEIIFSLAHS